MSLAQAVATGPRVQSARADHIQARITAHETRAKTLLGKSSAHRRKAKGGPLAKWHKAQANSLATAAERHRNRANRLREDLANAKAREAKRRFKETKKTVASTAADGLIPIPAAKPVKQGKPARPTKPGQMAKPEPGRGQPAEPASQSTPIPKGTVTMSGEVNDIETAKANLDQLENEIDDLKAGSDGMSGSFASLGLDNLSGALARIQDALDGAKPAIEEARDHLAKQEAVAEAAQNAGEMADAGFYGVG
jgi:ElaB/YqjD/DUF883 family membrane-anchored ribosome-binding protein